VWTEVPLADVMALRQATGAKLNDIVVSMVTTAIRRYTQLHRTAVKDRTLRMMVPVNIRGRDGINGPGLGNRISMMSVNLPLDVSDPLKQLHVVHETMTALKQGGVADFVGVAGNWLALTPTPLQALLGPYGSQLPFPPWNMVCTNVPGPQVTLYALGRRLIASYPYVPIGARMGLNCAVQSYDGKLFFGFTVSDTAAPDGAIMPKLLDSAFAELCKKAKVKRTKTIDAIAAEGKEPTAQDKLERPRARASHNGHKVADAHLNGGPPAPLKTELAAAKTAPEPAPV
jgi:diacylglycerol O-acyltransferase